MVSPEDLAKMLAGVDKPVTWSTGLLTPNTVLVAERTRGHVMVEYRKPQITGVWLEGSAEAVRVPMPGLLLFRCMPDTPTARPDYALFAVKRRPRTTKVKLYNCPLPNTYSNGSICWGTVAPPRRTTLDTTGLDADWAVLLGSKFGDHSTNGKSKAEPKDIRTKLIALHDAKAQAYPMDDLMPASTSLDRMINQWGN